MIVSRFGACLVRVVLRVESESFRHLVLEPQLCASASAFLSSGSRI